MANMFCSIIGIIWAMAGWSAPSGQRGAGLATETDAAREGDGVAAAGTGCRASSSSCPREISGGVSGRAWGRRAGSVSWRDGWLPRALLRGGLVESAPRLPPELACPAEQESWGDGDRLKKAGVAGGGDGGRRRRPGPRVDCCAVSSGPS